MAFVERAAQDTGGLALAAVAVEAADADGDLDRFGRDLGVAADGVAEGDFRHWGLQGDASIAVKWLQHAEVEFLFLLRIIFPVVRCGGGVEGGVVEGAGRGHGQIEVAIGTGQYKADVGQVAAPITKREPEDCALLQLVTRGSNLTPLPSVGSATSR